VNHLNPSSGFSLFVLFKPYLRLLLLKSFKTFLLLFPLKSFKPYLRLLLLKSFKTFLLLFPLKSFKPYLRLLPLKLRGGVKFQNIID